MWSLLGGSSSAKRLRLQLDRIGAHFRTVVLRGESGTGKFFVARALHRRALHSERASSDRMISSEKVRPKRSKPILPESPSLFSEKSQHTVYLEHIDSFSLEEQKNLLRWIGSLSVRHAKRPRFIATTRVSLRKMIEKGNFSPDLYHQLATLEIVLDPLRDRAEDIPVLAAHIMERLSACYKRRPVVIAEDAILSLRRYYWPGNLRELELILRDGLLNCDGPVLKAAHFVNLLPTKISALPNWDDDTESLSFLLEKHVHRVLDRCSGNKVRAAEILGISRSTLYRILDAPKA